MANSQTLAILQEIQALVSDKLQVVSYKWLSRNFLLSSDTAKRLLQEFVEKHGSGAEAVYSLSGWLKNDPSSYHIRLVSPSKLEEAKQEFEENCSVQVYSVQLCIPKDPAALWNAEFLQAEELFKQTSAVENCLRDNRFSGIRNSFVKRNVDGTPVTISSVGIGGSSLSSSTSKKDTAAPAKQMKAQQSNQKVDLQSHKINGGEGADQNVKTSAAKEASNLPINKKNGQSENKSSANGGSLANLWGRASSKSHSVNVQADNGSSGAQICAPKAIEDGSDGEAEDVNFKRASNVEGNRKRRVVFDYSDEEDEEAINLASPELPKGHINEALNLKNEQAEDKQKIKEEKLSEGQSKEAPCEISSAVNTSMNSRSVSSEKGHSHHTSEDKVKEDTRSGAAPNSPKRRKVVKTYIDERGREVSQVVWEGEETEGKAGSNSTKKVESNTTKKVESNSTNAASNRAPLAKKSPAVGNAAPGKAGNKKGANKDPKQGSLHSFFKRV